MTVHFLKDAIEKSKEKKRRKVRRTRDKKPATPTPPINSFQLCPTPSNDKAGVALDWRGPRDGRGVSRVKGETRTQPQKKWIAMAKTSGEWGLPMS